MWRKLECIPTISVEVVASLYCMNIFHREGDESVLVLWTNLNSPYVKEMSEGNEQRRFLELPTFLLRIIQSIYIFSK